jgi:hypothetical protein
VCGMAHQYSVEIHEYLSKRFESASEDYKEAVQSGSESEIKRNEGRIEALTGLRNMMTDRFDLKNRKYYH